MRAERNMIKMKINEYLLGGGIMWDSKSQSGGLVVVRRSVGVVKWLETMNCSVQKKENVNATRPSHYT